MHAKSKNVESEAAFNISKEKIALFSPDLPL